MLLRPLALAAALLSLSLAAQAQTSGLDRAGFDPAVRAQDDLFRAANGHWLNTVEMPADKSEYGAFIQLRDKSDREVRAIVEALAARTDNPKGSVAEKVALFYAAYSDLAQIDAQGLAPIKPWLAGIERIQNRKDLARWLGAQQGLMNLPIALAIHPDFKEPGINRPLTWQGGLGLPNRDYYLKTEDARFAKAVKDYAHYLETLARLAGLPQPAQAAQTTLALERRLAEAHWDAVANRDMVKIYNPTQAAALNQKAPGLDWAGLPAGRRSEGPGPALDLSAQRHRRHRQAVGHGAAEGLEDLSDPAQPGRPGRHPAQGLPRSPLCFPGHGLDGCRRGQAALATGHRPAQRRHGRGPGPALCG